MIGSVRQLRITRQLFPGSIICYHGLVGENEQGGELHVSVSLLEAVVDAVRQLGEVVPLREMVDRHLAGQSTRGLVALTFDDAYHSVLFHGRSLVERKQVPITTFAVSDALPTGATFWWDRIDALFQKATSAQWEQFLEDVGVPQAFRVGQPEREGPVRPLRQWILSEHRGRWSAGLEAPLLAAESALGVVTHHRSMTADELIEFSKIPGVDVGVHTRTHAVLPLLTDEELCAEVRECHNRLREILENPVPILAIPFGLFDERTVNIARSAGMRASLTLESTTLARATGRDFVPRFYGGSDLTPLRFAVQASGVPERLRGAGRHGPVFPLLPSATT